MGIEDTRLRSAPVVVALALAAALCFALASVLQHQVASQAPAGHPLRLGLLTHLLRRPRWLGGVTFDAAGYVLQVLALDRGALSLVQPLLAAGLLFALVFNTGGGRWGLRKRDWLAAVATAGGLAVFVVAGDPRGAPAQASPVRWAAFAGVTAAVVGVLVLMGHRRAQSPRAMLLAAGGGIAFGLSAALTKQALAELHRGVVALVTTGYLYGLAAAGGAGMLLSQSAFQAGALAASLPTLTLSEPVFAVAAGALLFGEHIRSGLVGATAVVAAGCAAAGVTFLARSPRAQPLVVP